MKSLMCLVGVALLAGCVSVPQTVNSATPTKRETRASYSYDSTLVGDFHRVRLHYLDLREKFDAAMTEEINLYGGNRASAVKRSEKLARMKLEFDAVREELLKLQARVENMRKAAQ